MGNSTHMKRKRVKTRKPQPTPVWWDQLEQLIIQYRDAAIAESWKGGGDPADIKVTELNLQLSELKLSAHIEKMKRDLA